MSCWWFDSHFSLSLSWPRLNMFLTQTGPIYSQSWFNLETARICPRLDLSYFVYSRVFGLPELYDNIIQGVLAQLFYHCMDPWISHETESITKEVTITRRRGSGSHRIGIFMKWQNMPQCCTEFQSELLPFNRFVRRLDLCKETTKRLVTIAYKQCFYVKLWFLEMTRNVAKAR